MDVTPRAILTSTFIQCTETMNARARNLHSSFRRSTSSLSRSDWVCMHYLYEDRGTVQKETALEIGKCSIRKPHGQLPRNIERRKINYTDDGITRRIWSGKHPVAPFFFRGFAAEQLDHSFCSIWRNRSTIVQILWMPF